MLVQQPVRQVLRAQHGEQPNVLMLPCGQKVIIEPAGVNLTQMANRQPVRIVPLQHAAGGQSMTVQTASPQAALAALRAAAPGQPQQAVQQGVVRQLQEQHYRPVTD